MAAVTEDLPAEVVLIQERRALAVPKMSPTKAAKLATELTGAPFGDSTWRKIENGSYRGGPDRIAIMALVLGITPEELQDAGRPDAARLLREQIRRYRTARGLPAPDPVERQVAADIAELTELLMRADPKVREGILAMLRRMEEANADMDDLLMRTTEERGTSRD